MCLASMNRRPYLVVRMANKFGRVPFKFAWQISLVESHSNLHGKLSLVESQICHDCNRKSCAHTLAPLNGALQIVALRSCGGSEGALGAVDSRETPCLSTWALVVGEGMPPWPVTVCHMKPLVALVRRWRERRRPKSFDDAQFPRRLTANLGELLQSLMHGGTSACFDDL